MAVSQVPRIHHRGVGIEDGLDRRRDSACQGHFRKDDRFARPRRMKERSQLFVSSTRRASSRRWLPSSCRSAGQFERGRGLARSAAHTAESSPSTGSVIVNCHPDLDARDAALARDRLPKPGRRPSSRAAPPPAVPAARASEGSPGSSRRALGGSRNGASQEAVDEAARKRRCPREARPIRNVRFAALLVVRHPWAQHARGDADLVRELDSRST